MKKSFFTLLYLFILFGFGNWQAAARQPPAQAGDIAATVFMRNRSEGTTIEAVIEAQIAVGSTASVTIYQAADKFSKKLYRNDNVPNCVGALLPGAICKDISESGKIRFIYLFPVKPQATDEFQVLLKLRDQTAGDIEQLVKASFDLKEVKPELQYFDPKETFYSDAGFGTVRSKTNSVILIPIKFPAPNTPKNKEDDYIEERIEALYDFIEPKQINANQIVTIKVEPLTKNVSPYNLEVLGFKLSPNGRNGAKSSRTIELQIITKDKFPLDKFNIEVIFNGTPPPELAGKLLNTQDGPAKMEQANSSEVGGDTKLGLRAFKNNLDLGVAFSSSVSRKEENGQNIKKRQNFGVVDLRFAPILNRALDRDEVHFFTPLFVDAKVSTGKIDEDSLSLNRVIIGTEYLIRLRSKNTSEGKLNKYIFALRGINASDRDFKRVEGKFNFEFRPLFDKLNNPLEIKYRYYDSILIPENDQKKVAHGWFGYQIQPFIGYEAGRVYREKRKPFNNEESSRNINRMFFGMDVMFDVTRRMKISLNDSFYMRGEASDARYRNYFNAELAAPIFTSGRTSQHFYFSYEKGDQPPFVSPAVNAFKFGYRIVSNFSKQPE